MKKFVHHWNPLCWVALNVRSLEQFISDRLILMDSWTQEEQMEMPRPGRFNLCCFHSGDCDGTWHDNDSLSAIEIQIPSSVNVNVFGDKGWRCGA